MNLTQRLNLHELGIHFDLCLTIVPIYDGICRLCGRVSLVILDPWTVHISYLQAFCLWNIINFIMKISLAFTTAALHLANDSQQPASNQSRYFQQSLKKVTHTTVNKKVKKKQWKQEPFVHILWVKEENPLNNCRREEETKRWNVDCLTFNGFPTLSSSLSSTIRLSESSEQWSQTGTKTREKRSWLMWLNSKLSARRQNENTLTGCCVTKITHTFRNDHPRNNISCTKRAPDFF